MHSDDSDGLFSMSQLSKDNDENQLSSSISSNIESSEMHSNCLASMSQLSKQSVEDHNETTHERRVLMNLNHPNSKKQTGNAVPMSDELAKIYRKRKMDSTCGIEETSKDYYKNQKINPHDETSLEHRQKVTHEKRVLININHPDDDPDVYLNSSIAEIAKPHQVAGIQFMFDQVVGSNFKNLENSGSSCILAHAMGLGKTLQTIALCDLLFRYTNYSKVICIAPVTIILNWKSEFDLYLPAKGKLPRTFQIYEATENEKKRNISVQSWSKGGGVLLMGYEMFRVLVKNNDDSIASELLAAQLVICDEGHRLKNYKSEIVSSLTKLSNSRKIILTGYPLQNNLLEYWCMINLIKPNFLGTVQQFTELFKSPIEDGQYVDSSAAEKRKMNYRSFVLHSILSDFLQREVQILHHLLPEKHDFAVYLKMTPLQEQLYNICSVFYVNVIASFAMMQKIVNHPDIIYKFVMDTEKNDAAIAKDADNIDEEVDTAITPLKNDINFKNSILDLMVNYKTNVIENSPKMEFIFSVLNECKQLGDRVVLFSQSLSTLDLIESFLQSELKWKRKWNYFRLDGNTTMTARQQMISEFNINKNISLFLMSTKAGALGINLTGANRLIICDISWNPCLDMQAISRVYRMGQTKPCFIYRLVTDSSLEKRIYDHQINKQAMSARIIDQISSTGNLATSAKSIRNINCNKFNIGDIYSCISADIILQKAVKKFPQFISSVTKHAILTAQTTLTDAEKSAAMEEFSLDANEINYTVPLNSSTSKTTTTWIPEQEWQKKGMQTKIIKLQQNVIIPPNIQLRSGQKIMLISTNDGQYIQLENTTLISLKSNDLLRKYFNK